MVGKLLPATMTGKEILHKIKVPFLLLLCLFLVLANLIALSKTAIDGLLFGLRIISDLICCSVPSF